MPNKCKNGWKNIFNIFSCLNKKYKIRIKKKNAKMTNISHNGPGGCKMEKRGVNSKLTQAQPKPTFFNLQLLFQKKRARFLVQLPSPDSLIL